jgi:succinate-acetate transporter protein
LLHIATDAKFAHHVAFGAFGAFWVFCATLLSDSMSQSEEASDMESDLHTFRVTPF